LFKEIQGAVTSALQSARQDGTNSDPNKIVEDAIAKVLQQHGSSATTAAGGAVDGDGDGDATQATANGAAGKQDFAAMLKSLGVDPKQFHADFLAAIKDAQQGQVDAGSAFKSFPPGTAVDAMA
jgi:hypothetical protein